MVIDGPPSPTSHIPVEETSMKQQVAEDETPNDVLYKTKKIKFLGVTKKIILQNKNGPCPLIAMCNVLLLRNDINLYHVQHELSEEKLLSLVANSLIEFNPIGSLFRENDEEYIKQQRRRISDSIDLLPSLAKGINVNIKFRRIDEFESTPELTTFHLLRIPLFHGWIYDPEDSEIATAIGSKSYNDLTTELVAWKTQFPEAQSSQSFGECSVNFSASITSALGVPSQRFSITTSVADSPPAAAESTKLGKGDIEEQAMLLQALTLSKKEALGFDICSEGESLFEFFSRDETLKTSVDAAARYTSTRKQSRFAHLFTSWESEDVDREEVRSTTSITKNSGSLDHDQLSRGLGDALVCDVETENSSKMTDVHVTYPEKPISIEKTNVESTKNDSTSEIPPKSEEVHSTTKSGGVLDHDQSSSTGLGIESVCALETENRSRMTDVHVTSPEKPISVEETNVESTKNDSISKIPLKSEEVHSTTSTTKSGGVLDHDQSSSTGLGDGSVCALETENNSRMTDVHVTSPEKPISIEESSVESTKNESISEIPLKYEGETFLSPDRSGRSKVDDVIPYKGKGWVSFGSPFYEGESLLGESSSERKDKNVLTPEEGEVIKKFLNDNATQLTWHGLLNLRKGLIEDELCVLFRNNHFYTMLKHNNELYTLVTDQGYLMEEDLVWERLDQINGDSVFITNDFKVFKKDSGKSQEQDHVEEFCDIVDNVLSKYIE